MKQEPLALAGNGRQSCDRCFTEGTAKMLQRMIRLPNMAIAVMFALLVSACTTQLAPTYDQSLVDQLTGADKQTLTLFASVSGGSEAAEYAKYSSQYDNLIGTFGALKNQAQARPTPPLAKKLADQLSKFQILKDICGAEGDPGSCVNSSPSAIAEIVKTLSKMSETHKEKGLKKDIVKIFKGSYEISINQALTVETALKRPQ
jgi:hypothetical protein